MVPKEGKLAVIEKSDVYKDLVNSKSRARIEWMGKKCKSDAEYDDWLRSLILSVGCDGGSGARKDRDFEEYDDGYDSEAENDPDYENVLRCLKECGKSYVLEGEDDNGLLFARYEDVVVSSDEECGTEPRSKLRSASREENGLRDSVNGKRVDGPKSTPVANSRNLTRRKAVEQAKNKKAENPSVATEEILPDPDYFKFLQASKIIDDCINYQDGVIILAKNDEKVQHDDDTDGSDVEILDSDSFYKNVNSDPSEMNRDCYMNTEVTSRRAEFRRKVIAFLRRPYDTEEYDKLLREINLRKPELHHRELRSGRDMSIPTETLAKSYLQRYPDLAEHLSSSRNNKAKCLNFLRGFFYWIQNNPHPGAFKPWLDPDCLSVSPGSC